VEIPDKLHHFINIESNEQELGAYLRYNDVANLQRLTFVMAIELQDSSDYGHYYHGRHIKASFNGSFLIYLLVD
jgi:hypothetical protein